MSQPSHYRRILIVRPSALGDVCRTVPVLATIKRACPDAAIDWVVQDTFVAAIAAHPALNEAILFPRARFARWWHSPPAAAEMWRWFSDLRRRSYDLVIDVQGLGRSGLITWATRAGDRVGFRDAPELAWLGYNRRLRRVAAPHTVDQMLGLTAEIGFEPVEDLRLYVSADDRSWWERSRQELNVTAGPYAVLAPTARWRSKRWPIERWRELSAALAERGFTRQIVIGAPGEADQVRGFEVEADDGGDGPALGADGGAINLLGRTTVGQTMAVIEGADLVVANDSAPLHMAVGFGRACVGLFGPTEPDRVGPYHRPEAVLRKFVPAANERINYRAPPLDDALMRLITTRDVVEQVEAALAVRRRDEVASGAGHLHDRTPERQAP